jgi:protein-L-isoaspartate(D-aspartate) O-methyltransferase
MKKGVAAMTEGTALAIERMIRDQLLARGIDDDDVLTAFEEVPRHVFVSPEDSEWAYGDHPLPIGCGQTVSQPYIVALALQAGRIAGSLRVLEIGTGSGYQTALLARLAGEVWSVERIPALSERAKETLASLGVGNVFLRVGNGCRGWPEGAPYEAIVVSAAARTVPPELIAELAEGGRLVIPVGDPISQRLLLLEKHDGGIRTSILCDCRFVPLVDSD